MMKLMLIILFASLGSAFAAPATQPSILNDIGIDQRVGESVPLDLVFRGESDRPISISQIIGGKPTIIVPVYFRCPMLCSMTLNGLERTLNAMPQTAGNQFNILTFSIDANETPAMATKKKLTYLRAYRREGSESGWRFLTGDVATIAKLTQAIGFRFVWDEKSKTYAHAAGIVIVSSDGTIRRYFDGTEFEPAELWRSLTEASAGKSQTISNRVLQYCFAYDPRAGRYGQLITRALQVCGMLTLASLVGFIGFQWRKDRRLTT